MIRVNAQLDASKRELRRAAAAARDALSPQERETFSLSACRYGLEFVHAADAAAVMAYAPFRSELDIRPLIEACWQEGRSLIVPRVHSNTGELSLHEIRSWNELAQGTLGIPEPAENAPETDVVPDVIFVPGLAFDPRGGRLGYGRGYYDRLRARLEETAGAEASQGSVWIGTAFGVQIVEEVPMDKHDAYMDWVMTETGIRGGRRTGRI